MTSWRLGDNTNPTSRPASVRMEGPRGIEIKAYQQRSDKKERSRQKEDLCEKIQLADGRTAYFLWLSTGSDPPLGSEPRILNVLQVKKLKLQMIMSSMLNYKTISRTKERSRLTLTSQKKRRRLSQAKATAPPVVEGQWCFCMDRCWNAWIRSTICHASQHQRRNKVNQEGLKELHVRARGAD